MSSDYHPHFLHVTLFAFILIALLGVAIERSERDPVLAQTTRTCTDGVDCFADCITNTPGTGADVGAYASAACQAKDVPIRPRALIAEDFEAITFWKGMGSVPGTSGPGSGATACVEGNDNANCYGNTNPPLYGPPYDPTGGTPSTKRGWNSAYYNLITKNTGSSGWAWQEGNPTSPTYGGPCISGSNYCDNLSAIWSPDNRYGGNSRGAIYVYRGNELTQESTAVITAPNAPFDGKQSLGLRFPSGIRADGQPHYFDRSFSVPRAVTVAHASAYSSNFFNSSIIDSPIKHEEFGAGHPFSMWTDNPPGVSNHKLFPYSRMSMFTTLGEVGCNTKRTAIINNLHPGDLSNTECLSTGSFRFWPNPADYDQAIDFPAGQFRCMRSSMTGIGTTNGRLETWNGSKKIIDFSNMDLTSNGFFSGYPADVFYMNRFSNRFQLSGGDPGGIDETVWNVEDNYVFETWSPSECAADPANCGKPLTCAQIGFTGVSNPPPTDSYPSVSVSASPTTLTVGSAVSLSASASDDKGVSGVQFKVDGVNQGSEDTVSPYTLSFTPTAGNHTITAVARDTIGQTTTANPVTITVNTVNLCGNGTINSGEQCDGTNLGGQSCSSFGFTGGSLSCNASCQLVTTSCTGGTAPAGVTASYSFDNSTADISGNGNSGTPTNGPTYTTGHSNQALLFDGIDDYVDIGDKLNLTVPFTVAAWVRLDSGATGDPVIFTTDDDTNYTGFKLFVEGSGVNTLGVDLMNGGAPGPGSRSTKLATTPLSYGTWTHVAAVVNGVGNVTLYQNGQPVSGTYSGSATTMLHTSSPARIGRRNGNNWKGAIDDLNIYTKALSASEVQALASGTGASTISSLSVTTPSLETTLTGNGRVFSVSFYTPGQTNALSTVSITGTAGALTFTPTSLNPGTYDVAIKTNKYLSRRKTNLTLANSTNLGSFSSLYTGDLDGNNTINSLDWSLMNNVWFTNSPANDLNEDGIVNSLDRALLIRNWFRIGE